MPNPTAGHPIFTHDGELAFLVSGHLVVLPKNGSDSHRIYNINGHHSIEIANDQNHFYIPGRSSGMVDVSDYLSGRILDDSIIKVSASGAIIQNLSFGKILISNNFEGVLFGRCGERKIDRDLTHINQISVAQFDGKAWLKDDLLISARHFSEIYLYRPVENKIVWRRSGSWKNQHSVHFVSKNKIALLDNNVYGYDPLLEKRFNFVREKDINRVIVVDFETGEPIESEPYRSILEANGVRPETVTKGEYGS